tara:strand:- start:7400 stop:7753 length:354 start_codon:yes stop_codon:yes gene_type:complete
MKFSDEDLSKAINDLTRPPPAKGAGSQDPTPPTGAEGDGDRDMKLMALAVFNQGLEVVLNQTPPEATLQASFTLRLRDWLQWALGVIVQRWIDAGLSTPELKHRRSILQAEWAKRCL